MRLRLFAVVLGLCALSLLASQAWLSARLDAWLTQRIRDDLYPRLDLIAERLDHPPYDVHELGRRAHARLTLIAPDGTVLADSELKSAENHGDRPEVQQALSEGKGFAIRYSATVKKRMLYAAQRYEGGVLRLALPLTQVDQTLSRVHGMEATAALAALALALALAALSSHWMTQRIRSLTQLARKLAEGDLAARTRARPTDEIGTLGHTLDLLAESLADSLATTRAERDLLGSILDSMQEGVLLLDADNRIVRANRVMEAMLLQKGAQGQLLLEGLRDPRLVAVVDQARHTPQNLVEGEMERPGGHYLIKARATERECLVVVVDVSPLKRMETVRRDFVANVSHELRTPLTVIMTGIETLKAAPDPAMRAQLIESIENHARRMHRLLEDLLDLARIESGARPLVMQPIDLEALAYPNVRNEARGRVEADPDALDQILTNLIDNARKHGDGNVTISNEGTTIKVSDTGPGIDPSHHARLFERFYRVDPGRSRDKGGTGLGLAIVRHLVEAMGGQVGVHSGKGTTVWFTLPSPDRHKGSIES